jgi:glutathione S-transferase
LEFLPYCEDFELPADGRFERVRTWRMACQAHPAAQQVTAEEVVKLYDDDSLGVGKGALPTGRQRSSFVFEPDGRSRPWPPRGKPRPAATDVELGLA